MRGKLASLGALGALLALLALLVVPMISVGSAAGSRNKELPVPSHAWRMWTGTL